MRNRDLVFSPPPGKKKMDTKCAQTDVVVHILEANDWVRNYVIRG